MPSEITSSELLQARLRRFVILWLVALFGAALIGTLDRLLALTGGLYSGLAIGFVALIGVIGMPIAALGSSLHANRHTESLPFPMPIPSWLRHVMPDRITFDPVGLAGVTVPITRAPVRAVTRPRVPDTPIFIPTASPLASGEGNVARTERLLDQYMRENQPLTYATFEAAAAQARRAGPQAIDPEEWLALLDSVEDIASEAETELPGQTLRPVGFVHELSLGDIRVEATESTDRPSHLAFRAARPEIDALWLPSDQQPSSQTPAVINLRIITSRSLLGSFKYIRSAGISPIFRLPQSE